LLATYQHLVLITAIGILDREFGIALLSAIVFFLASPLFIAKTPVSKHRTILCLASRQRNCAAPPLPLFVDLILGIGILIKDLNELKNNRLVEEGYAAFRKYGKTYGFYLSRRRTINTIDPRSLQIVMTTEHEKFSVGSIREEGGFPLIGRGVLTTNGEDWKKHRSEIMPIFAKTQITDGEMFERHYMRLLQRLEEHDGTGDLKPLFEELVGVPDEIFATHLVHLMA
jgi:hypothetical protein